MQARASRSCRNHHGPVRAEPVLSEVEGSPPAQSSKARPNKRFMVPSPALLSNQLCRRIKYRIGIAFVLDWISGRKSLRGDRRNAAPKMLPSCVWYGRTAHKPFVLLIKKTINLFDQLHKFLRVLLNRSLPAKLFPTRVVFHGILISHDSAYGRSDGMQCTSMLILCSMLQ